MHKYFLKYILVALLICCLQLPGYAQQVMKGKIVLKTDNSPLESAYIINTRSNQIVYSEMDGSFEIEVLPEDIIEFRKMGFKIERTKIRNGPVPFYQVALESGAIELPMVFIKDHHYVEDSLKAIELYDYALRAERREDVDPLQNPFVLLDKRARQIWEFQRMFDYYESEKYIDYIFNEDLVLRVNPDFDEKYMDDYLRKFRPTYGQVKSWSRYEYLKYVQTTSLNYQYK